MTRSTYRVAVGQLLRTKYSFFVVGNDRHIYIYILPKYIHRDWNWRLRQIAEYIHIYILGIGIGVSAKLRICHT